MKDIVIVLVHLLTTVAKLLGPGGTKAVLADWRENLKHSRIITTTAVFALRSTAIRWHKSVVHPKRNKPTWSITDGKRIVAVSSSFQWWLS